MDTLLDQMNPTNKEKMRLMFESLRRVVSDSKIDDRSEETFDPVIKLGLLNCLVQALSIQVLF